ncbi:MAG: tetratricopeptide repeat protein [Thermoguttaceae bacterium]
MTRLNRLRPFTSVLALSLFVLGVGAYPVSARAENEGQADLDKATQQKLGAQTPGDLTEVIQLCEAALKKGLDKGNTAFANDLIASALVKRGSLTASKAYHAVLAAGAREATDNGWKTYRSEALADLEKGVKLSPKQPQAQFEIAKLNLLPGGSLQKAMEALDKTIAQTDDDAMLRAEALVQRSGLRDNFRERLADLDEAVRVLPGNAVVLRKRGLVRAEAKRWDDALADFDKAIAADPKQVMTYQMKAAVLAKTQKWSEALAVLEKGHSAAPNNIDLLLAKGEILVTQSNYKAAADELTRALAIDGSNLPILDLRARLYEQLGEKTKALADVDKILKTKPGDPNTMRLRALLLAGLGKPDAAIEELQNLHKANPKDSLTMLQLGMVYMTAKKYDKAIEVFTAILVDHPDEVEAMRGRADALLNSGRRADAISDYERALKLQAHDVGLLNNFAWVLATAPEDKLRDGHRALALATDACRQTEYKQDFILSTLAAAFAETGDFESARKWAAQAVEAKPSNQAEPTQKDELRKELESYKANKPWREALPAQDEKKDGEKKSEVGKLSEKKPSVEEKKDEVAEKKKKPQMPAPMPDDADSMPQP